MPITQQILQTEVRRATSTGAAASPIHIAVQPGSAPTSAQPGSATPSAQNEFATPATPTTPSAISSGSQQPGDDETDVVDVTPNGLTAPDKNWGHPQSNAALAWSFVLRKTTRLKRLQDM